MNCVGGEAHGNLFRGGPTTVAGNNSHFGIMSYSSSKISITDNRFTRYPGDETGKIISAIYLTAYVNLVDPDGETTSYTRDCVVSGNKADNVQQHFVYVYGQRCIFTNNVAKFTGTAAYQIVGQQHQLINNEAYYCDNGIVMGDSVDCIIANNTIYECDQAASYGIMFEPFSKNGPISGNMIKDNIIYKSQMEVLSLKKALIIIMLLL